MKTGNFSNKFKITVVGGPTSHFICLYLGIRPIHSILFSTRVALYGPLFACDRPLTAYDIYVCVVCKL